MTYEAERAKRYKVIHEFSGKAHFYKVISNNEHNVSIQVNCDCKFMGIKGVSNNQICSHVLAVFHNILENGLEVRSYNSDMLQQRRNNCLNLVRKSNRKINEFRSSEGINHEKKKREIFDRLLSEKKQVITEAIFENGKRADILCLDEFKVYEIIDSESDESISKKLKEYPKGLSIEFVRC